MTQATARDALLAALKADHFYAGLRAFETLDDPAALPPGTAERMIHLTLALGHFDQLMRIMRAPGIAASLSPAMRELGTLGLFIAGRGDLVASGAVPLSPKRQELGLLLNMAQCLEQVGESRKAMSIMAGPLKQAVATNDLAGRVAMHIGASLFEVEDSVRFAAMAKALGLAPDDNWVLYQSLRYVPVPRDVARLRKPGEAVFPSKKMPLHTCIGGRQRIAARDGAGWDGLGVDAFRPAPSYRPDALSDLVARQAEAARTALRAPWFAERLDGLARVRERFAPDAADPIQVISTGRAGTTALQLFLRRGAYLPYHTFVWQLGPRHRFDLLNRLLTDANDPASLAPALRRYLSARITEWIAAYRLGKTPVIVSHWDVIFAPFLRAMFPEARFLHLHRRAEGVAASQVGKRQFAMSQLIALPTHRDRGEGTNEGASFLLPPCDMLPDCVGWYMAFTRHFHEALTRAFPSDRHADLASEALFEARPEALDALHAVFPDAPVTQDMVRRHFGRKINEKQDHSFDDPNTAGYIERALAAHDARRAAAEVAPPWTPSPKPADTDS
ncbi:hypothetical protein KAJ83_11855 [Marivibrio halodurans]|uniref:Sulfotransferase family protein n=1 Tax=Marivibrio halodurans TaxID=2039722 RepID=A0A8J7RZX2_9PROT|nr:hypothetical protein [Marivibrio halodurans]MBP5857705.1 hypothetical protein [Marivibrio halodurans]